MQQSIATWNTEELAAKIFVQKLNIQNCFI